VGRSPLKVASFIAAALCGFLVLTGLLLSVIIPPSHDTPYWVQCVALSPDGKHAAACNGWSVKAWDANTATELWSVTDPDDSSVFAFFTLDGKKLVTTGKTGFRLRDTSTGELCRELILDTDLICGRRLLSPEGGEDFPLAPIRNIRAGLRLRDPALPKATGREILSPDGKRLAVAFADGTVAFYDMATGEALPHIVKLPCTVSHMFFGAEGRTLVVHDSPVVTVYDRASGKVKHSFDTKLIYTPTAVMSPDGQTLAVAHNADITLWDVETGRLESMLRGYQRLVLSMEFSQDGRKLLTGGSDWTVCLWDVPSTELLWTLPFVPPSKKEQRDRLKSAKP
jgi:WD40 repeat protein